MPSEKTFFSYSRVDSTFVLKLAKDLRDAGAELWLDQLDIKAGSHWDSSIEEALNSSSKLIVVLSPASVASNNVMDEVSFGLESGKTVIPVLLSECVLPFRLRRLQHIDFTGDYQKGLDQLLELLGRIDTVDKTPGTQIQQPDLTKPVVPPSPAPIIKNEKQNAASPLLPGKNSSKKYVLIAVGALFIIAAIWGIIHVTSVPLRDTVVNKDTPVNKGASNTTQLATHDTAKMQKATETDTTLQIGGNYHDGIVFYLDGTGHHGLMAATRDFIDYYKDDFFTTHPAIKSNYGAAKYLCETYRGGGYSDWRLPTADELRLLYNVRKSIQGLYLQYGCCDPPPASYWSSTSDANGKFLMKGFASGNEEYNDSGSGGRARAVRSF